jgi:hypothetical protein
MKFTDAWLDEGQKRQVTRGRASGVPFVHAGDSHPCSVPDALYPTPRVIVLARQDHAAALDLQIACGPSMRSIEHYATAGRVNRRCTIIAPAIAIDPNSSSIIQPGTAHGRPIARRCQTQ